MISQLVEKDATSCKSSSFCMTMEKGSCRVVNRIDFLAFATVSFIESIFVDGVMALPLCVPGVVDELLSVTFERP